MKGGDYMLYKEASKYTQLRFKREGYCMICGKRIEEHESFEYISIRISKSKLYNFFHTSCLANAKPVRIAEAYDELVNQTRG